MDRQQRYGKPYHHAGRHEQELACVTAKQVLQGLLNAVVDAPTLLHGSDDRLKVVIRDDHVRGLFGDLCPGLAHGDADVCALDGRCVVHTIARHGHDGAVGLQGTDDPQLVLGSNARVDGDLRRASLEFFVGYLIQFGASDD